MRKKIIIAGANLVLWKYKKVNGLIKERLAKMKKIVQDGKIQSDPFAVLTELLLINIIRFSNKMLYTWVETTHVPKFGFDRNSPLSDETYDFPYSKLPYVYD